MLWDCSRMSIFVTHNKGHTLDQVYIETDSNINITQCCQGPLLSDHYVIHCCIAIPRNVITVRSVSSRKLKGIVHEDFMNDINSSAIKLTNLEEAVSTLNAELTMLYSAYASTVHDVVPTSINIHGYADDHILKKSFAGASRTE